MVSIRAITRAATELKGVVEKLGKSETASIPRGDLTQAAKKAGLPPAAQYALSTLYTASFPSGVGPWATEPSREDLLRTLGNSVKRLKRWDASGDGNGNVEWKEMPEHGFHAAKSLSVFAAQLERGKKASRES